MKYMSKPCLTDLLCYEYMCEACGRVCAKQTEVFRDDHCFDMCKQCLDKMLRFRFPDLDLYCYETELSREITIINSTINFFL